MSRTQGSEFSNIYGGELPASNVTVNSTAHSSGSGDYIKLVGSSIKISGPLVPNASDGSALGTTSLMWSDLFLASGGVINWNNGNYTATHSAGNLTLSGILNVTSDLNVNTNKFNVTASSGNTLIAGTLGVTGAATLASVAGAAVAVQSDQETATSTTTIVTPGRQHFHPGHCKAWARVTVSASTPTLGEKYNCTSVTDSGAGITKVNFTNSLSTTAYCAVVSVEGIGQLAFVSAKATDGVTITTTNLAGTTTDNINFMVIVMGDI